MNNLRDDLNSALTKFKAQNRDSYVLLERLVLSRKTLEEIGQHFQVTRESIRLDEVRVIKALDEILFGGTAKSVREQRKRDKTLPRFGFPISHTIRNQYAIASLEDLAQKFLSLDTPMVLSAQAFKEMYPELEGRLEITGAPLVRDFVRAVTHNFELSDGFVFIPSKKAVEERIGNDFNDYEVGPGLSFLGDTGLASSQSLKLLSNKDASSVLELLGYRVSQNYVFSPSLKKFEDSAVAVLVAFDCKVQNEFLKDLAAPKANLRGFINRLAEDPRISRPDPEHFEIARGDRVPLRTIHELLQAEVTRLGGMAPLSFLTNKLTTLRGGCDISPSSVHAYSGKAPLKLKDGMVYLTSTSSRPRKSPMLTKNVYNLTNGWRLRICLNEEAMRGSGIPLPMSIVNALEIELNEPKRFTNDVNGEIHEIRWGGSQPIMTAVRKIALELNLGSGDWLIIDFLNTGVAHCRGVKGQLTGSAESQLKKLLGLSADSNLMIWLAAMIGCKSTERDAIALALQARFEGDSLELLKKIEV